MSFDFRGEVIELEVQCDTKEYLILHSGEGQQIPGRHLCSAVLKKVSH